MSDIAIWQSENVDLLPVSAKTPIEITSYAVQLSTRDKNQIVSAFGAGHYEMAINFLWGKTFTALKKELSAVGVGLLGEMLGKADVDEDDSVDDILTPRDAIKLAEELGILTSTDAMRLRHTHELISHFSQLELEESDSEDIEDSEALSSLRACVKGVLGRPKVEVARKFVEFRDALESETLQEDDNRVDMLKGSPYFFHKLTVSVLMNAAKKNNGANLEHALANINILIPAIWTKLRESEKWQVGYAYAEAFADGKKTSVGGLKQALLKVKGFDYVPENLRSDTFVKAADAIVRAHEGFNNFYNETAPVKTLLKLGSTIPTPALPSCISALLCVVLGNNYGVCREAVPDAMSLLSKLTPDRWEYYLNNTLPSDTRIINKLTSTKPRGNWIKIVNKFDFYFLTLKNKTVKALIDASTDSNDNKVILKANVLLKEYYGRN